MQIILSLFLFVPFASAAPSTAKWPLSLKDAQGNEAIIPAPPKRIVSSNLAADEILWELLAKDRSRVIAFSKLATNPTYSNIASQIKPGQVGTFGQEAESLIALKPDLVLLASYNNPALRKLIQTAKVPSYTLTGYDSFAQLKERIRTLGQLTETSQIARQMIRNIDQSLAHLTPPTNIKRLYSVLYFDESLTLPGKGTMFDDICKKAHVSNTISDLGLTGWAKLSEEKLLTLNADYIVMAGGESEKKALRKDRLWSKLPAVKENRVIALPTKVISSVSHHVVAAPETIYKALYGNPQS